MKSLHMVKAKKMNNDIKKYIKYVKKIISIHSKDKKEFIQLLTQKIIEFSNEHDSCSYQDIVDEFGNNLESRISSYHLTYQEILQILHVS